MDKIIIIPPSVKHRSELIIRCLVQPTWSLTHLWKMLTSILRVEFKKLSHLRIGHLLRRLMNICLCPNIHIMKSSPVWSFARDCWDNICIQACLHTISSLFHIASGEPCSTFSWMQQMVGHWLCSLPGATGRDQVDVEKMQSGASA